MYYLRFVLLVVTLIFASLSASADLLNINTADQEQLAQQMVGIGPNKALAIVEHRGAHGPFKTIDELVQVKGIGPQTVELNRETIVARPLRSKP